ncbi:MAG: glycosyl transferase family 1 [Bdellovibrionales bacterium RIFOXYB1_FULL_37_110]|nr:MAG: glycosyl transferase family 1 [Bdellovibrionales bacterium RIFOXYC1_FULL_37_79]OFZ59380.1 MAG: glycosyl transferase family 1 [Bdellovibrionales bacterium RIFOXYB1_FULL_37_110]OFZ61940.1 MAG: glycosyl transferase family 1 [Bdellovibrionales bacterium RIFOXYD1_FULL_36_51]
MLNLSNISKSYGGIYLYQNATFQINPGEKFGLVGANGTGKTTLFRLIMNEERPDSGQISFPGLYRISYFSQSVGEMQGRTALQEVIEGDQFTCLLKNKLKEYEQTLENYNDLSPEQMSLVLDKMGQAQIEFEKVGGYDLEVRAEQILTGLGIGPLDHLKKTDEFSGGWKMRIALAKVLVTKPDLIIMDEPTNYLDLETILWLEDWLKNFKGSIFMTTHDRDFMNNVCNRIAEVSNKKITVFSGNYDFYEKERDIRLEKIKSEHSRQQSMLQKEEEFIARFKARASHAAQVQSRIKMIDKIERVEIPENQAVIDFEFPVAPRGGDDVIIFKNLSKSWVKSNGEPHLVFSNLDATILRKEKIAVVGVNGAGKSTLLKIIAGQTTATSGEIKLGPSIKLGYFSQFSLDLLKPENTALDEVRSALPNASDGYLRNLLAALLFRGDDVFKKVKHLSGGEKSRLILATILSQHNNLLVLDEPTNHLDLKSREILLNALKRFEGTVVLVSHDRHFLHALTEKVYEVSHNQIIIYPGNYDYYVNKKQKN